MKTIIYTTIFLFLVACTQQAPISKKDLKKETNNKAIDLKARHYFTALNQKDYWLNYPENWDIDTSGTDEIILTLFSPIDDNSEIFRENVNLTTEKLPHSEVTLSYYTENALNMIKGSIPDVKIIENKLTRGRFSNYQKIIYKGTISGMKLKWKQAVYIKNSIAYISSYTALESTFSVYDTESEEIMKSIYIK